MTLYNKRSYLRSPIFQKILKVFGYTTYYNQIDKSYFASKNPHWYKEKVDIILQEIKTMDEPDLDYMIEHISILHQMKTERK